MLDSHVHLLRFQPAEHVWVTDEMPTLRRDFLPAELAPLMRDSEVTGCVAVQARQLPIENAWLLDLAASWPSIQAVVGWIDLCALDLGLQLDGLADQPLLKGFRHVVIDEPGNYLDRADVRSGIGELGRRGYLYEFLVLPHQLGQATDIARQLPSQQFVLDHAGLPDIRAGAHADWADGMRALAACANVNVKLSALDFRARWHEWTEADLLPYLETTLELFGSNRIMMGSNWPVCTLSSTYSRSVAAIVNFTDALSASERDAVLTTTARQTYNC
jgi:L-fuconolactonase